MAKASSVKPSTASGKRQTSSVATHSKQVAPKKKATPAAKASTAKKAAPAAKASTAKKAAPAVKASTAKKAAPTEAKKLSKNASTVSKVAGTASKSGNGQAQNKATSASTTKAAQVSTETAKKVTAKTNVSAQKPLPASVTSTSKRSSPMAKEKSTKDTAKQAKEKTTKGAKKPAATASEQAASEVASKPAKAAAKTAPANVSEATEAVQSSPVVESAAIDNIEDTHADIAEELAAVPAESEAPTEGAPEADAAAADDAGRRRRPRVQYSDAELEEFRVVIEKTRQEAVEEFQILRQNLEDITNSELADENASYSMHMAEQGTEAQEKEKIYAQVQRLNDYIKKLDEALLRIKEKTYGICRVCGILIAKERLIAVPITTLSASYKIQKKCPEDGIDRIVAPRS